MSNFTVDALNIAADAVAGDIATVSLHSADPGDTGLNELSGGSYARQSVTFDPATGGDAFVNNSPTFDVPPDGTVAWLGFWDGAGTPEFKVGVQVVTETYSENGGTYQVLNTTKLSIANPAA